jgi:RNA polymerase sigma-70 factor (ECF subfamily)
VQPARPKRRQIEQALRPHGPLRYETLSDPILVRRAKDGDERAFAALCERYAARVQRLAVRVLGDNEDARDAAQEALAKLCVRLRQFRGESQFSTWLHRLVVNTCRDLHARRSIRRWEPIGESQAEAAAPDADPARLALLAELRSELSTCLDAIPAAQARVVVLKDGFDYSFEEISAASGIPVGTAKCYAHRGRNRLRARLEQSAVA